MTRPRACQVAASALVVVLSACSGGQGPTQPDIERDAGDGGGGMEEPGADAVSPAPTTGESPDVGPETLEPDGQ